MTRSTITRTSFLGKKEILQIAVKSPRQTYPVKLAMPKKAWVRV
jgi:hypothetical protein